MYKSDIVLRYVIHKPLPHLTDERDWLLAHGMRITNVGLDDLSERLLHSLRAEKDVMI